MCDHWSNATIAPRNFTKIFFSLDWFCIASIFAARFIWPVAYVIWIYDLSLRLWLLCNFKGNFNLKRSFTIVRTIFVFLPREKWKLTERLLSRLRIFIQSLSCVGSGTAVNAEQIKSWREKKIYFIKRCGEPMECSNVVSMVRVSKWKFKKTVFFDPSFCRVCVCVERGKWHHWYVCGIARQHWSSDVKIGNEMYAKWNEFRGKPNSNDTNRTTRSRVQRHYFNSVRIVVT